MVGDETAKFCFAKAGLDGTPSTYLESCLA